MPLRAPITDAEIEVYHQNTSSSDEPDAVLDSSLINQLSFDSRADQTNDECSIDIDWHPNQAYDLRMGDRIQVNLDLAAEGDVGYGVSFGESYAASTRTVYWTGRILATDHNRTHEGRLGATLQSEATDYVGGVLKERQISGSWIDRDVGSIIRDICERKASEIDYSNVPDFGVTTDLFLENSDCWDAIVGLAARADGLIHQDGLEILVDPVDELPFAFDLEYSDYYYPWDTTVENDVKNVIRVDSGTSRQEEEAQETQDSWQRVTQGSRITHRLRARKSAIHSIDLYIRTVSDEQLTVRLQSDEDGAPVAIDDDDSNIDSAEWSAEDLPDEGWHSFFFDDHTLPDRDPWMIIETDGDEGHDIGIDSNDVPTYTSYYPHPLSFEDTEPDSIDEYGSRELKIERDNLDTLASTQDAVQQELARQAWPTKEISFPAKSHRAHALEPGDVIGIDNPDEDAVGDFIVTEVSRSLEAGTLELQTDITGTWRKGLLAPQS